jgi:hypothetical protein
MQLTPEERQRIYEEEKARHEAQERIKAEAKAKVDDSPLSMMVGCLVIGVCVVLALGFFMSQSSSPSSSSPSDIDAHVMARSFVRDRLVAPSTADFSSLADTKVTPLGGNRWSVSGWVDAQNAFGAKLRRRYSCTLRYEGHDNWRAESVSLD